MPKKPDKIYAVVVGFGEFPLDMLRYDGCYPESQEAVAHAVNRDGSRAVVVARPVGKNQQPIFTDARWESFLWKVVLTTPSAGEATDKMRALNREKIHGRDERADG